MSCADTSEDLCPYGHFQYGLLTLTPFIQPAVFFAIGEFKFYKGFRFGGVAGKLRGQGMNRLLRWALLPLYVIAMIPLFPFLVIIK